MKTPPLLSLLATILLLCSNYARGETHLCIASAGVALEEYLETRNFTGGELDVADEKFIYSNESGDWKAKAFSDEHWHWDDCGEYGVQCRNSTIGWAGMFRYNSEKKTFTASYLWGGDEKIQHIMVGGKCSSL